jgi:hypothetical protein
VPNARRTWPRYNDPPATFLAPDGVMRSERSLAGPLRLGTAPGVGPNGMLDDGYGRSDFGMDRISPRCHDPIGRAPYTAVSRLVSRYRGR